MLRRRAYPLIDIADSAAAAFSHLAHAGTTARESSSTSTVAPALAPSAAAASNR